MATCRMSPIPPSSSSRSPASKHTACPLLHKKLPRCKSEAAFCVRDQWQEGLMAEVSRQGEAKHRPHCAAALLPGEPPSTPQPVQNNELKLVGAKLQAGDEQRRGAADVWSRSGLLVFCLLGLSPLKKTQMRFFKTVWAQPTRNCSLFTIRYSLKKGRKPQLPPFLHPCFRGNT